MLAFLPVFNVGMSLAGFVLAGAWLVDLVLDVLEGTPWRKFQRCRHLVEGLEYKATRVSLHGGRCSS